MAPKTVSGHFSTALLDNATIRGALIALGLLDSAGADPRRSVRVFDVQVAAAETFVETLILHDRIVVPKLHSDYPAVDILQDLLGPDLTEAINLEPGAMAEIEATATRAFQRSRFGAPAQMRQLRRFAGVDPDRLEWDRVLLSYYGVFKGLGHDNLDDQSLAIVDVPPLGDIGRVRTDGPFRNLARGLSAQEASLLWLTWRTFLYDQIAAFLDLPYVPHPSRTALWKAVNLQRLRPTAFAELPIDVLTSARLRVAGELNEAASWQMYDLRVPPLTDLCARQVGDVRRGRPKDPRAPSIEGGARATCGPQSPP